VKRLAIETATEACSVSLEVDGCCIERSEIGARVHARVLLPWIASLLAEAGIAHSALDCIAVDRGPGGFTSLRLGLSVAQGIALAHDLPVYPVSSLAALASQAHAKTGSRRIVSLLDARMGEVYAGWFEFEGDRMRAAADEWLGPPESLPHCFDAGIHGVGSGFARFGEVLADALGTRLETVDPDALPSARAVAALADRVAPVPGHRLEPTYLRDRVTG